MPAAVVDAASRALDSCGVSARLNAATDAPETVQRRIDSLRAKAGDATQEALSDWTDVVDELRAATPSLRLGKDKKNNILRAPEERTTAGSDGDADLARAAMDAVLPASIAMLAFAAVAPDAAPWPAAAWALAEVCSRSYAVVAARLGDLGGKATVPAPAGNTRQLWRRCLEHCEDVEAYVVGWFYGAEFASLTRGDVEAWLSGNVFGGAPQDKRQTKQLAWMVERLEERLSSDRRAPFAFPAGTCTHKYMCAQESPGPLKHHPLLVYAIIEAAKHAHFLTLKNQGFERYSTGGSDYWRREASNPIKGATPLIFAHGIGIGLLPYHTLIDDLAAGCERDGAPIYLLELPALALTRFGRELPSPPELGAAATAMLATHEDPAACWVGHSFGTAAVAYALKNAPATVASCVLVEPVCFQLHLPDVSRGFLFRETQDPILDILRTDPAISFSLRKRFWWQEAVLWVEDLGGRACDVFLASKDGIVPSAEVTQYLSPTHVGVRDLGDRGHGTWQYDEEARDAVLKRALSLRRRDDTSRVGDLVQHATQRVAKSIDVRWPGDDVSILGALRGDVPESASFVDVMSRALYGAA